MRMKKLIFQVGIILCLSFVVGISANLSLIKQYRKGDFSQSFLSHEDFPSIQFIGIFEAEDLFAGGNAVFLDSRAEEKYLEGHILGAVNIPFEGGERIVEEQLPFPREATLIVYCDGNECQSSVLLAKVLAEFGFEDIRVFFGGWAEWVAAGLPLSERNDT
ncbi:MAG: rhodanese-like domain-containing protein [Candidatus Aminicenantes bacterium]|nr:rhodanese-like domain-containing protein [Candidatus Aminicenantes bacterium]